MTREPNITAAPLNKLTKFLVFIIHRSRKLAYGISPVNQTASIEINQTIKNRPQSNHKGPIHGASLQADVIGL